MPNSRLPADARHTVLYLRDDGVRSIPVQRRACRWLAAESGLKDLPEFVDGPGTECLEHRPEFVRLLGMLRAGIVARILVAGIEQIAPRREDELALNALLRQSDTTLSTYSAPGRRPLFDGQTNDTAATGPFGKVCDGGTPFRPPLGYVNVHLQPDGRHVRAVGLDRERAAAVGWAFEQFATGRWTLRGLADAVARLGLTSRPTARTPAGPLSVAALTAVLRNPYYIGLVSYRQVDYHGTHPTLVTPENWLLVQDLLASRRAPASAGVRTKERHELDGLLCCGACGSKLTLRSARAGGGQFCCAGRQPEPCAMPRLDRAVVEQGVETFFVELGVADYLEASADQRARLRPLIVTRMWISPTGTVDYAQHTKAYQQTNA